MQRVKISAPILPREDFLNVNYLQRCVWLDDRCGVEHRAVSYLI
jgi:hypothetical protein